MTDIITMPEELYRNTLVRFNPAYINTASQGSAFNPFGRVDGPTAVYWQPELVFSISKPDTYIAFRRMVMKMRGGKTLLRLYDQQMTTAVFPTQPRGAGGTGPVVNVKNNAATGAEQITLKNLIPDQATALKYGDQLGIGENLYVVEDDAPSDSNGYAAVNIQPPLRMGVAANDPVNLVKPTGLFRLTGGGENLGMDVNRLGEAFTLNFIEEPMFA